MRLKQCIFALMAMLLCAFSANASGGSVAKIGDTEYTTFADAMAAANATTGNVDVEVYGAVEFVDGMELNGSYTAITFTGKSEEAKITINQTAGGDYLTAHGKTVAFNGLILAKANPAWSGNSGHMGNYFSIQGGTVTYTDCTFPNGACTNTGTAVYNNCTFQNSAEYGLWVYDDALVTVNGGTIDSKKGIKVYSEGEQDVTSTLTVKNATFTENVTAKPAVAVGYAQSITLIGNTYNNPTAHVELDSGSDADCEGITFVAQDSEGNDIASTLEMTDRSNSSAPCGVLVDGKIYTTVTTAAAEATEGSTVTLLYNSTEEVELPEGVTLDKNGFTADNVTVATSGVAQVGENVFTTVLEALQYAIDNNAAELKILCDVREKMTIDFDLNINADLTITADAPVKVEFYNDGTSYDFAVGSTNNNTLTIGENVHFDLVDRVIWLGYWGNNVTVVVNGYLGGYQIWHGANTVVNGTLDSHGEAFIMRRDATLTANEGAKVNANYFQIYSGHIVAENATITAGLVWVNNNHDLGKEGTVSFELDNTEFTSNGEVKIYAGEGKIVSVTLENSSLFDAKGVVTLGDNVKVVADATSSIQDANGSVVIPVAKIGETSYASLAEALTAASAMSGDVTIEVYDKVTLNTSFSGSYSSINFVGKDTDAEIYLDVQGYITATGKKVSFTDLTLSKSQGGYITNAGFMNVAFGIYDVTEVTYTNCVFANGAYASSGNVTFNDCTFYRSYDKYGLWAYGDVNATVEGCTFADYRGIKMYAEGAAKTVDLTVKNTDFSAVTDKPAIVLTYGESVVLEGNTYSSTGTFELDLDGAPNGTAVTSDVAPTCKNDNGTCGVLVDGNIYTTVAQAAEVAAAGSNVTLLYSTTDAVEFAEGVNLTLANGVIADNVTVATSAVAKIGDTTYATLAEAVADAQAGDEIVLLADAAEDVTLPAGVTFNGNGKAVGNLTAGGEITFTGVTKATSFGVQYTNTTVNIVPGASLEITGTGRMVIGHGCTFNITGNIENAKTADVAALTPSLIMPGASFTGAGVTFNVTNAYISAPSSYCSSSSSASGTFDFNITNSIWESAGKLAFESQSVNATVNFDLVESVLNTGSHLVFGVSRGEVVIDNSNVNVGTARQIENQSTMTIKNGSVVNGAVATSSNAKNPGTLIVDNATYAVTGEFSGSDLGTGTIIVKNGATVSAGSITKANIQIDATGMAAGDEVNLTADLSKFAGTIEVVNNDNLDASIVDGKIVLAVKPVAKIGETSYATLEEAISAAQAGDVVEVFEGTYAVPTMKAGITIEGVGNVLLEGTLSGSLENLTLKNLYIKGANAQRWAYAKGNLVFENVTFEATSIYALHFDDISEGTNLLYKNCTIIGWAAMGGSPASCVFDGCTIKDNGTYGVIRTYFDATIENCTFDVANAKTDDVYQDGIHAVGGAEVTVDGCINANGEMKDLVNVSGTSVVSVDGVVIKNVAQIGDKYYASLAEAVAAAESGATITLMNGEHELPLFAGKELTFVGESKDGVIVNDAPAATTQGWNGSTFHFENLTAKGATENYHGLANGVVTVTYKNCNINGLRFLYATEGVTFEDCAFNAQGVEHSFWTYGASNVTVKNSTFTYTDRAVNCYSENGANHETDITFEGCSFTYAGSADAPEGAVEINSGSVKSFDVAFNNCTAPEKGAMWFNSQWDSKQGENTVVSVDGEIVWQVTPAVAKIGEQGYETLAAALTAAQDGDVVTLVWADGDAPIAMNGSVFGKSVTITGTANVDWSKNWFFVGRGGAGNGTVTFDGANLTSASANDNSGLGIHVSGREKDTNNKYDGTLVIKNSTIELDYLINRGAIELGEGAILTVKNGFGIAGRPASETESGEAATATVTLNSGSKLVVNNHNGMGVGQAATDPEGYGVMNVNAGAAFETTQAFLVTSNGTMNVEAGSAVSVNGTLTVNGTLVSAGNIAAAIAAGDNATIEISGGVYTQNVNEWCVENYVALQNLDGNYVVGVKPTATVNNLGMTTIAAGDYSIWNGSFDQNTEDDGDMPLSFVMQFLADQDAEDMATSPYADWYGDFVITFTGIENGSFKADGCYLAGHYGSFGWVKVPVDGMTIDEGVRYPVMLGVGLGQKYDYICSSVEDFKCALYLTPEILEANPNIKVKLELAVVDNSKGSDAAASALVNNENVYSVTEYTYDAEDFVVKKDPEVVDGKIEFVDGEFNSYTNDTDIENVEITYKRTIDSDWNALYVPFAIPASELLDNFDIAYINDVRETDADDDGELDGWQMELIKIKNEAAVLKANHPYFVRSKSADYTENNLSLTLTTTLYKATVAEVNCSSMYTTYTIKGLNELRASTEFGDADRVLGYDNGETTWGKMADGYSLKPFRFYLTITNHDGSPVVSSSAQMSIVVRDEDGTTGIGGIYGDENGETVIFDLYGRRVLEPEKGNIYIINGKKVLVK